MSDRQWRMATTVRDSIQGYVRRAEVLRQIHGRKASVARRWEIWYLVITVFVATLVTVLGFAGPTRIAGAVLSWIVPADRGVSIVEIVFNIAVLVILILTLVGLVYRHGERANQHFRSVEILTEFIRDTEDAIVLSDSGARGFEPTALDITRTRYKGIIAALPPNTDREYLRAKRDARSKREKADGAGQIANHVLPRWSTLLPGGPRWEDRSRATQLSQIIDRDSSRVVALQAVEEVLPKRGWIIGGFIREAVWDALIKAPIPPPLREVDVSYYDLKDTTKEAERRLESRLRSKVPNVTWSVKNQARMHLVNDHDPYRDVSDALRRAPETASAVAIQLRHQRLRVIAPLGLSDLFEFKLRRSPLASEKAFNARLDRIQAPHRWPSLERVEAAEDGV